MDAAFGSMEIIIIALICLGCLVGVAGIGLVTFLLVRRNRE